MAKQLVGATPAGDGINWEDFKGKLFVVEPLSVEKGLKTRFTKPGETKDAVRANVYVLTGKNTSEDFEDSLIFPGYLQGATKRHIGELVVGRLVQGDDESKGNKPWLFAEPTAADMKKAADFVARRLVSSASEEDEDEDEPEDDEDAF